MLLSQDAWPGAIEAVTADEIMSRLVHDFGPFNWELSPPFRSLARAIVGQMLSAEAARHVFARLNTLTSMEPRVIAEMDVKKLRSVGVSARKVNTLKELAALERCGELVTIASLEDDQEITDLLTRISGVGTWTVQMFLIFSLGRPDIWPIADGGMAGSIKRLYGVEGNPELIKLGQRFVPYRSVAAWYMWRWIDANKGKRQQK